jgi:hypothetical protein
MTTATRQPRLNTGVPGFHPAPVSPRLADYCSLRTPVLMLAGNEMRAPVQRIGELLRFALPNVAFFTVARMVHMGATTHSSVVAPRIAGFVRECAFRPESAARELAA